MKMKSVLKLFTAFMFFNLFLSQYVSADIYDNFNDGSIDTDKWMIWEGYNTTPVVENNGVLNIDYPPGSSWGGLNSKALLGGDFDIRAKWKNWQFDGTPGAYENDVAQIGIQVQHDTGSDWGEFVYEFRGWFPNNQEGYRDQYVSNAYIDDAWRFGEGAGSTPSDTSGYFGIERVGSTINTYYSDVNYLNYDNWNQLNQVENAFTEPVRISLRAYTGDHTNSFHAEWDNVEVEADREVDVDFWNVGKRVVEWADRFKTSIDLLSALEHAAQVAGRPLSMPFMPTIMIPPDIWIPEALRSDPYLIYDYPELFGEYAPTGGFVSFSPVDLQVIDPLGNSIGKTYNDFSNALYFEGDFWDTGITNDMVLFWGPFYGDYEINVIPEIGALPEDIFSLLAFDDTTGQRYVSTLAFGEEIINQDIKKFDYNTVPEPSSLLLLSIGMSFLFAKKRKN